MPRILPTPSGLQEDRSFSFVIVTARSTIKSKFSGSGFYILFNLLKRFLTGRAVWITARIWSQPCSFHSLLIIEESGRAEARMLIIARDRSLRQRCSFWSGARGFPRVLRSTRLSGPPTPPSSRQ